MLSPNKSASAQAPMNSSTIAQATVTPTMPATVFPKSATKPRAFPSKNSFGKMSSSGP